MCTWPLQHSGVQNDQTSPYEIALKSGTSHRDSLNDTKRGSCLKLTLYYHIAKSPPDVPGLLIKYVLWAMILVGVNGITHAQAPENSRTQSSADEPSWSEHGLPYLRNYLPEEYKSHPQNWSVAQNPQGLLYVANGDGLLAFDGARWHSKSTYTPLRSLAMDSSGTLYAGSVSDIGYFTPDARGELQYTTLLPFLDEAYRDFTDIWQTFVLSDGVYFCSRKYVFRWADEAFTVWTTTTAYNLALSAGDQLYVHERSNGLLRLVGDELVLDPAGTFFETRQPRVLATYDESSVLIGTYSGDLFLYDGNSATPFPTSADAYLKTTNIYGGASIPGGYYAIGTMRGGVVILDRTGNIYQVINETTGLADNSVWFIHPDVQGGLWLALNSGLTHLESPAPLSQFPEETGLQGSVESIARHQGTVYVGTSRGVYYLASDTEKEEGGPVFKPVSGIENFGWTLLSVGNTLLAGTTVGVYEIDGDQATAIRDEADLETTFHLYQSQVDPSIIYAAAGNGLGVLKQVNGRWMIDHRAEDAYYKLYRIGEDEQGQIWGGMDLGALRITPDLESGADLSERSYEVAYYDTTHGLSATGTFVGSAQGKLMIGAENGLYLYDEATDSFVPDPNLGDTGKQWGLFWVEDEAGHLWSSQYERGGGSPIITVGEVAEDGTYAWDDTPFLRMQDLGYYVTAILPEDNGVVWIGSPSGLFRYDARKARGDSGGGNALVRRVTVAGDSTVYFGAGLSPEPVLPYQDNTLRFEYASTNFEAGSENEYRIYLEGFDASWSNWTAESLKEYTNVPEGTYRFRVQAKNVYGQLSEEAVFMFRVLPPWYRTWWAYGMYLLLAGGFVFGIVRWRSDRLDRENRRLEKVVEERTAALQNALHNLTQAQGRLIQQEKMASLGQLAAGIAHEIKNPLNFVNNFSRVNEELLEELKDKIDPQEEDLNELVESLVLNESKINKHGQLANRIVELMMQHASRTPGERQHIGVNKFVDESISLVFHSMLSQNPDFQVEIAREFDSGAGDVEMVPQEISQVLVNLFNNAYDAMVEHQDEIGDTYTPRLVVATERKKKTSRSAYRTMAQAFRMRSVKRSSSPFLQPNLREEAPASG